MTAAVPDKGAQRDARGMARSLLDSRARDGNELTPETLEEVVSTVAKFFETRGTPIDQAALTRQLEAEVNIFYGRGEVMTDPDDSHKLWLDARRADIEWGFWEDYRAWTRESLPPSVVNGMDTLTDEILDLLGDPAKPGPWDRRGMVVGQVQSGKTGNYTGLICKAADAGYKFIVVLAGMHNSLRSQTQQRLDEGFLGLDSQAFVTRGRAGRRIGVGALAGRHPQAWTLTSSDEKGDFRKGVASSIAGTLGHAPVILVVKKNGSILRNLIEWVTELNGSVDAQTGRRVVRDIPLLVIDDEADNASVNTKEIDYETVEGEVTGQTDPSTINKLIRQLLHSFESSSLVSYTATPFANIFIDSEPDSPEYGEDLFPRSFILRMPAPSNYLGPAQVFGISPSEHREPAGRGGLPVIRTIEDAEDWLRTGHRKDDVPRRLPTSLREAIRAFLLVCVAREARGQTGVHNSMLVHVTRFVDVQHHVAEQVRSELDALRDELVYGGAGDERAVLRKLWEQDFGPTAETMPPDTAARLVTWADLEPLLANAVRRIKVREVNGSAGDALEYRDHPDGLSVIAVGGDKLSRGLTLEGLSVSYYLRASKMYDTLLQMGRWFGYRSGYADLIRLYTTGELQYWYREIALANLELEQKFDEMAHARARPTDFALYVRQSPAGLLVTSTAKMRSGRKMYLSFAEEVVETSTFERDEAAHKSNLELVGRFVERETAAGTRLREDSSGNKIWTGVDGQHVASLLDQFKTSDRALKVKGSWLASYIRDQLGRANELTEWTVVVMSNSKATDDKSVPVGNASVGMSWRSALQPAGRRPDPEARRKYYSIRRIGSPGDQLIDLSADERKAAMALTLEIWERSARTDRPKPTRPSGAAARAVRPKERGLLVLYVLDPEATSLTSTEGGDEAVPPLGSPVPGFLVSFPRSPTAKPVEYVVPRRYFDLEG